MSGENFFDDDHYTYPKQIIEIHGKTIIERAIAPFLQIRQAKQFIFLLSSKDVKAYNIDYVIRQLLNHETLHILVLENATKGALCSALMGIDYVNNQFPLIISNSDHIIDEDLQLAIDSFVRQNFDAAALCFDSIHPKWSYVQLNEEGLIVEAAEKRPISRNAIAGFYYYRVGSDFVKAAMKSILKGADTNGIFYLSASFNELILMQKKLGVLRIESRKYIHFYDSSTVKVYEDYLSHIHTSSNHYKLLAERYIVAFANKDVKLISEMITDDFILEDPVLKRVEGKQLALEAIRGIFSSCNKLSFAAKNIYQESKSTLIEFLLVLDDKIYEGVDVIEWRENKIAVLRAYLDVSK
jgi:dTDP-glucose pyrophosphorylase